MRIAGRDWKSGSIRTGREFLRRLSLAGEVTRANIVDARLFAETDGPVIPSAMLDSVRIGRAQPGQGTM